MKLSRGQRPFSELLTVKTCHDIRKWTGCDHCGQIGDKRNMVRGMHGRCFAAAHGVDALMSLPREETSRLSLGDLGTDLMAKLLNRMAA